MDSIALATQAGIALMTAFAVVCISALFERQLPEVIGTFFALILRPFLLINDSLQSFWRGVKSFYSGQFTVDGQIDLQRVFFQFIGAMLYTAFFVAFNLSEFHLLSLSFVAAGIDAGHFNLPVGTVALTAIAVVSSVLFWGAVICDLSGMTNTAPWREALSVKWRRYLLYTALSCLGLSLFVSVTMGLFRGKVIADESLNIGAYSQGIPFSGGLSDTNIGSPRVYFDPATQVPAETTGGFYYWIPIIANVCIPILVVVGGVFSSWGLVTLIKFVMLIAGFIIISPLGLSMLISNLFVNIVDRLYQFLEAVLRLLAAMGHRFMGLFGWNPPETPPDDPQGDNSDSPESGGEGDTGDHSGSQDDTNDSEDDDGIDPPHEGWDPFNK